MHFKANVSCNGPTTWKKYVDNLYSTLFPVSEDAVPNKDGNIWGKIGLMKENGTSHVFIMVRVGWFTHSAPQNLFEVVFKAENKNDRLCDYVYNNNSSLMWNASYIFYSPLKSEPLWSAPPCQVVGSLEIHWCVWGFSSVTLTFS